ncbi:MAG: hypothetical protein CR984_03995 [Proteobacteria bacterium]|nr:MAG: hypothetical protein CR984_03995 [Pseudomonadota bacterium]
MTGITLAQAESKLSEAMDAVSAVMAGQQVRMGDKWLTRADLDQLQRSVTFWDSMVKRLSGLSGLSGGGIRIVGGTPL